MQCLRDSSQDVAMAFYSAAQSMSSSQIKALCKRQVTTSNERSWGWAEEGAFKPLGVWATLGHDKTGDGIERGCFARTVWPKQSNNLAPVQLHAEFPDHDPRPTSYRHSLLPLPTFQSHWKSCLTPG